jgi:hypothetical protein
MAQCLKWQPAAVELQVVLANFGEGGTGCAAPAVGGTQHPHKGQASCCMPAGT